MVGYQGQEKEQSEDYGLPVLISFEMQGAAPRPAQISVEGVRFTGWCSIDDSLGWLNTRFLGCDSVRG